MFGLEVEKVSYSYHGNAQLALKAVNLSIKAGTCLGLIGPNGAGKSTLLSILSGLLEPSNGKVKFTNPHSTNLSKSQFIKQHIALVPQEYAFYNQLTVIQNLKYFISLCALNKAQAQQRVTQVITQCQLASVVNKKTSALSGGYKRRVNLAIALLKEPQILYLDEPTVGVDPVSRQAILDLISTLKQQGKTLIFTSHMLSEIQSHCDDIVVLKQGRALRFTEPQKHKVLQLTFAHPISEQLQAELSLINGCHIESPTMLRSSSESQDAMSHTIQIVQVAQKHGAEIESMQYGQHSLTEQYLTLMAQDDLTQH